MRAARGLVTGLVLLAVLSGCGQKGPLYRESPDVAASAVGAATTEPGSPAVRDDEDAGE